MAINCFTRRCSGHSQGNCKGFSNDGCDRCPHMSSWTHAYHQSSFGSFQRLMPIPLELHSPIPTVYTTPGVCLSTSVLFSRIINIFPRNQIKSSDLTLRFWCWNFYVCGKKLTIYGFLTTGIFNSQPGWAVGKKYVSLLIAFCKFQGPWQHLKLLT